MGKWKLCVSKPEQLPDGSFCLAMCVDARPYDMGTIRSVHYVMGGDQEVTVENAECQFLAEIEIDEWKGKTVESSMELTTGENWECCVTLSDSKVSQEFVRGQVELEATRGEEMSYANSQRLDDLENHIKDGLKLIADYENELLLAQSPKDKMRSKKEIEDIGVLVAHWRSEYESLRRHLSDGKFCDRMQGVEDGLRRIEHQLTGIDEKVAAIDDGIRRLEETILAQCDVQIQHLVKVIIGHIDHGELPYILGALEGARNGDIPSAQVEEMLTLAREGVSDIEKEKAAQPDSSTPEAPGLRAALDDPKLNAEHRLELCVTIIPFLLTYKRVLKLSTGVNVAKAWNWLKGRFSRET